MTAAVMQAQLIDEQARLFEAPPAAVWPGLESCGLAVEDTAAAVGRLAAGAQFETLREEIARGSLLEKKTLHGRKHFLLALRRRVLSNFQPLPGPEGLAAFFEQVRAPTARAQVLLPYLLLGDRLAWELSQAFATRQPGETVKRDEVVAAVRAALERHGRRPWNDATSRRWASGFLSVLREVGWLGRGAQRERVLAYSLRPEAFSFHLLGLYRAGHRGRALRESALWRALLADPAEVYRALRSMTDLGWWRIHTIGAFEEYLPVNERLNEWGGDGLGPGAL